MVVRYLLDTNICIYIAKHHPPEVRARFASSIAAGMFSCEADDEGEI